MNEAYLLSNRGEVIEVLNHPSDTFEFESILDVLEDSGNSRYSQLVHQYIDTNSKDIKNQILSIYDNTWCKVRVWEYGRLVTFRITSTNTFNWYRCIVEFLLNTPSFKNSKITVESDKRTGRRRIYWDEISYEDAISPQYETILATKMISQKDS